MPEPRGKEYDTRGARLSEDAERSGTPDEDRFARARDTEEPGASSGAERMAQEREVPGTAGSREGYQRAGTGSGEPLKGVKADEQDEDKA